MNEYFLNEEKYTRVITYLYNEAPKFGLSVEEMKRMKPTPNEIYVSAKVVAGGTAHLISGATAQEIGVTNLDGKSLESGRYFVIDAVKVLYGEGDADAKVYDITYKNANELVVPAVLSASHLVVRQSGEVVVNLPLASVFEASKTQNEGYRVLGALATLVAGKGIEITIETPVGSTITPITGGKSSFVKVLLRGFETYVKR